MKNNYSNKQYDFKKKNAMLVIINLKFDRKNTILQILLQTQMQN